MQSRYLGNRQAGKAHGRVQSMKLPAMFEGVFCVVLVGKELTDLQVGAKEIPE